MVCNTTGDQSSNIISVTQEKGVRKAAQLLVRTWCLFCMYAGGFTSLDLWIFISGWGVLSETLEHIFSFGFIQKESSLLSETVSSYKSSQREVTLCRTTAQLITYPCTPLSVVISLLTGRVWGCLSLRQSVPYFSPAPPPTMYRNSLLQSPLCH